MKKFVRNSLLVIAIFFSFTSKAQSIDTTTIEGLYQYIFNILDKTQVPTHYLEEYGVPVLTMGKYNGLLTDSNVVDINVWRTLYWQIASAYIGTGTNSFAAITNVNSTIRPLVNDSLPVPVPLLFANYNSVKSNAFTSNLLQIVNNQVKDVAGRPQSPYQQNNLFAAAPAIGYTNTGTARFIFKSNLFYTNSTATVNSISIDFANGTGYQPVTLNNAITVNYYDTGVMKLKIKLVLSDNTTSECYTNFYVAKANSHSQYQPLTYDANSWDLFQPFVPTINHSGGNVYVRYSRKGTERTITKPLIIVEGYDINHAAPDLAPNYTYKDFVDAITQEPGSYNFNGNLDDIAGYDLIFVDYKDGTDDIARNAALVEVVIAWVNSQKAANGSVEQNVVMGISMGGLVARYALADMTKSSITTGTRLLITHDSPHRGANVPLGLQYLIQMAGGVHLFSYNIRDVFPEYDEAINLLAEPATQQLLLYRAIGATTSVNNTFLNTTYRNMITFSPTDPQPAYSFVATSLGSQCGQSLFPAYQQLINSDVDAFAFFFPLLSYHFRTTVKAYALPNTGSTNLIASLLLKSKFKLFGLITISKQIYNNSAYAPGSQLPVDGTPGGKITLIDGTVPRVKIFGAFAWVNLFGYVFAYSGTLPKHFCFIPAGSALDVSPFNTNTFSQKFVSGINPNYPSTSKTYIAQETISSGVYNNDHPRFTARNAEWIYDQMENITNTLNCSTECSPDFSVSVSANPVCTNAVASIAGLSPSATVTWSATPSGIVSITPNGQQATVTKTSSGNVTITGTVNSCNSYSKTLHAGGYGSGDYPVSGPSSASCNSYVTYTTNQLPGATNYSWFYPGSWTYISGQGTYMLTLRTNNSSGNYQVGVRVANTCDAGGSPAIKNTYVSGCNYAFIVSPNPATTTITINTTAGNSKTNSSSSISEINIYDQLGNLKIHRIYNKIKNISLDVSNFPTGIYVIEIKDDTYKETQKLQILKN
jgi:hypothetical protein